MKRQKRAKFKSQKKAEDEIEKTSTLIDEADVEETKLQSLNIFKQNFQFSLTIRNFRNKVSELVHHLCKKDGLRDFDAMA